MLNGPTVSDTPKEIAPPDEPVQVYTVHTDVPGNDPIIFIDENGDFFVDGQPVNDGDVPADLAEFDPGQELNAPADDTVYGGHGFHGFDSPAQAPLGEHDPVRLP